MVVYSIANYNNQDSTTLEDEVQDGADSFEGDSVSVNVIPLQNQHCEK